MKDYRSLSGSFGKCFLLVEPETETPIRQQSKNKNLSATPSYEYSEQRINDKINDIAFLSPEH